MANRFVRDSILRNVYGNAFKKDQQYTAIRVSKHGQVQMVCAVNPKFMACVTHSAGGGSFLVLPITQTGRMDVNQPQVTGHKSPVNDIAWSPFNDNIIASSDDGGVIMVWQIDDKGLHEPLEEPLLALRMHTKRCTHIKWHPIVENVLLSAGQDLKVFMWNLDDGEPLLEVAVAVTVQDICWNLNGSLFATATKDKMVRIYNPRTGAVKHEIPGHDSQREMKIALLKGDRLVTTGFSKGSTREYRLWDVSTTPKKMYEDRLDQTNAPLNIYYDPDLSMVYLVGKGDSVFRYYEINDEEPYMHYISTYQSSAPQKGMGYMPKRACNVNNCEVARMYKVLEQSSSGVVEPISLLLPRKSELFQADVFPDTAANEPTLSIEEWFNGKDLPPKTMSMKQFYVEDSPVASSGGGGLKGKISGGGLKGKTGGGGLKKVTAPAPAAAAPVKAPEPVKHVDPPAPKATSAPAASYSTSSSSKIEDKEEPEPGYSEVGEPEPEPAKAPEPKVEPKKEPEEKMKEPARNQSGQIDELVAEIAKLKATVAEQEMRIATLEKQVAN